MGGHDRFPNWLELMFERRVQTCFKEARRSDKQLLRLERYATLEDVADSGVRRKSIIWITVEEEPMMSTGHWTSS
jgi:hypothetical protein